MRRWNKYVQLTAFYQSFLSLQIRSLSIVPKETHAGFQASAALSGVTRPSASLLLVVTELPGHQGSIIQHRKAIKDPVTVSICSTWAILLKQKEVWSWRWSSLICSEVWYQGLTKKHFGFKGIVIIFEFPTQHTAVTIPNHLSCTSSCLNYPLLGLDISKPLARENCFLQQFYRKPII